MEKFPLFVQMDISDLWHFAIKIVDQDMAFGEEYVGSIVEAEDGTVGPYVLEVPAGNFGRGEQKNLTFLDQSLTLTAESLVQKECTNLVLFVTETAIISV